MRLFRGLRLGEFTLPGYSIRAAPKKAGGPQTAVHKTPYQRKLKQHGFVDEVVVRVRSGRGGNGGVSFAREAHKRIAPPDGGNGGRGGDVLLRVSDELAGGGLRALAKAYAAGDGGKGMSLNRHGANGRDAIIDIPAGCVVTELERFDLAPPRPLANGGGGGEADANVVYTQEYFKRHMDFPPILLDFTSSAAHDIESAAKDIESATEDIESAAEDIESAERSAGTSESSDGTSEVDSANADMAKTYLETTKPTKAPPKLVPLLRGGLGGRGNASFASSVNRGPRQFGAGGLPQQVTLRIEYKMLADVGLVGLPNAGKSTLLNAVTNARSKVGYYPFTTITPAIGVLPLASKTAPIRIADIPGLIPGASEDRGLGHAFLRHVQRTRLLLLLVDMAAADPAADLACILAELRKFDASLVDRGARSLLVVGNKADAVGGGGADGVQQQMLAEECGRRGLDMLAISARDGTGTRELVDEILKRLFV